MNKKKWTITLSAILLVLLSVAGYFAIAAEYGTQEDPLVTLSYVNNVLSPQVMQKLQQELDAKAGEVSAEIDTKVKAASDEIDKKIAEYQPAAASGTLSEEMINSIADAVIAKMQAEKDDEETAKAPVWELVTLKKGQQINFRLGCEFVLRIGEATCVSSGTTGPISLSDATVIGPGKNYVTNHLYLVTIDTGRGLKAVSDTVKVLVCGDYTIQ